MKMKRRAIWRTSRRNCPLPLHIVPFDLTLLRHGRKYKAHFWRTHRMHFYISPRYRIISRFDHGFGCVTGFSFLATSTRSRLTVPWQWHVQMKEIRKLYSLETDRASLAMRHCTWQNSTLFYDIPISYTSSPICLSFSSISTVRRYDQIAPTSSSCIQGLSSAKTWPSFHSS